MPGPFSKDSSTSLALLVKNLSIAETVLSEKLFEKSQLHSRGGQIEGEKKI